MRHKYHGSRVRGREPTHFVAPGKERKRERERRPEEGGERKGEERGEGEGEGENKIFFPRCHPRDPSFPLGAAAQVATTSYYYHQIVISFHH